MNPIQRIEIITADITQLKVDAIVNAANERMLGGGGVDGAIHRVAGRELFDECKTVPEVRPGVRCPTGEARITTGCKLPARFVIHTVGPIYADDKTEECSSLLASCYRESLRLAEENKLRTIAFPCISTGAFGFPQKEAAKIAHATVMEWLDEHELPEAVTFCCYSQSDEMIYRDLLAR